MCSVIIYLSFSPSIKLRFLLLNKIIEIHIQLYRHVSNFSITGLQKLQTYKKGLYFKNCILFFNTICACYLEHNLFIKTEYNQTVSVSNWSGINKWKYFNGFCFGKAGVSEIKTTSLSITVVFIPLSPPHARHCWEIVRIGYHFFVFQKNL